MCGICGAIDLRGRPIPEIGARVGVMNDLIRHRGPDDDGVWVHEHGHVALANRRLAVIDLEHGHQPMSDEAGRWITYNGEVYNHAELRTELGSSAGFRTHCDTEVVLRGHAHWGLEDAVERMRGMFAYGLWDEPAGELICVRDRFGVKPLYYALVDDVLWFASEAKALLPCLPEIATDAEGLRDYLAFQYCLDGKTLFAGVRELPPGHSLRVKGGSVRVAPYWEIYYDLDWDHTDAWFQERTAALLDQAVDLNLRSDVPVGVYLSGGIDSSAVAALAARRSREPLAAFTGRFHEGPAYDESAYARLVAERAGLELDVVDISSADFARHIEDLVYHLDYPTAGPGALPQYVVSRHASAHRKVLLGGQGGDEVFGGYARYLIAYFEQCIKAAIDGTMHDGDFVVTYESIIPNLATLRQYKPLMQHFWRDGLFDDLDARYFRLVNRTPGVEQVIRTEELGEYSPFETFQAIFNGSNTGHQSYFDKMTHFDLKTLLPALLHVEDRVSMAHGLESRVPMLDHRLVELAATVPADKKFKDGQLKYLLRRAVAPVLPPEIESRADKMGFPVPLTEWMNGPLRDFVGDLMTSEAAASRPFVDNRKVLDSIEREGQFGRQAWGLIALELWQRAFHDRASSFAASPKEKGDHARPDNGRGRVHRLPLDRPAA